MSRVSPIGWFLIIVSIASFWLMLNKKWRGGDNWNTIICSDGRGYYAWLPAMLIYHDLNFGFADSIEHVSHTGGCLQDYRIAVDNRKIDKYYPGTAVCFLPFFLIAHGYCVLSGNYPATGYSEPYFFMIAIAGLVFLLLGLWVTHKVLDVLGFSVRVRITTLCILLLGSNLISYGIDYPSYSHIYSFTLIGLATLLFLKLYEKLNAFYLIILAFIVGLIVVIRPVNITWCLLLFAFVGNTKVAVSTFKQLIQKPSTLVYAASASALMPAVLIYMYYLSSGNLVLYSYKGESFDFLHPNTYNFIFSQDNGILLYTPALVLAFVCAPFLYRINKPIILAGIAVLAVSTYVHSSWWCWWYGHAFGSRTLLDFNVFFAVLIAYSLASFSTFASRLLTVLYSLTCLITLILYHQTGHGYLGGFPRTGYIKAIVAFWGLDY
jgi:hypothetical protein